MARSVFFGVLIAYSLGAVALACTGSKHDDDPNTIATPAGNAVAARGASPTPTIPPATIALPLFVPSSTPIPPTRTPSPFPTATPRPTSTPTLAEQTVQVRWNEIESWLTRTVEPPSRSTLISEQGPTRFFLQSGGETVKLYETNTAVFTGKAYQNGRVLFQTFSGAIAIGLDPFTVREVRFGDLYGLVMASPDAARFAVRDPSKRSILIVSMDGQTQRLLGLDGEARPLFWLDSESVAVSVRRGVFQFIYRVPVGGNTASLVTEYSLNSDSQLWWSREAQRMAYVSAGNLYVWDAAAQKTRLLASSGVGFPSIAWSQDGNYLLVGGELYDAVSVGRVVLVPGSRATGSDLSADGRFFVAAEYPSDFGSPGSEGLCTHLGAVRLTSRLIILDRDTGTQHLLLDCGTGFFPFLRWLPDSRHLLASGPVCWQCGGGFFNHASIVDVFSGVVRELTPDERFAFAYPSPNGHQILVGGPSLRLFDDEGNKYWDLDADPERYFTVVVWLDDHSFVYVVGPYPMIVE